MTVYSFVEADQAQTPEGIELVDVQAMARMGLAIRKGSIPEVLEIAQKLPDPTMVILPSWTPASIAKEVQTALQALVMRPSMTHSGFYELAGAR